MQRKEAENQNISIVFHRAGKTLFSAARARPLLSHLPVLMAMARPFTEETVNVPSSEQMLM